MKAFISFGLLSLLAASPVMAEEPGLNPSLVIKDGRFSPETVEVLAGKKFRLEIHNQGTAAEEFESSDLNREKLISPGAKTAISIGPLKPGTYRFFGEFNPKTAQGVIIAK